MNGDKSPHIMNASTNLVGFTFIVFTSLKAFHLGQSVFVAEMTAVSIVGFMLSTLFSFASIRTNDRKRSATYETIAGYVFFSSLLMMFAVCVLLTIVD
jgi:uncharacterized membrane protein